MKVSILKISRNKEVIKRLEVAELAEMIRHNPDEEKVYKVRLNYQFMQPQRLDDGQIVVDNEQHTVNLPRILFAAECVNFKEKQKGLRYNGLVVIEVNGLKTYEEAVNIRNQAARMDETMMAFLGASGKSVKIVCRGELFQTNELPQEDADIRQFHKNLYDTARRAYQNQFGIDIEYLDPKVERTVYMSADPEMYWNPDARPFKADTDKHDQSEPAKISWESDRLMPGRTITRTYHFNWLFIVKQVLGDYFKLEDVSDEDRQMQLLMRIASMSLEQGIPLAHAQGMTLEHPILNKDPELVKNVFSAVYDVALQEDYLQKHKVKPLKSVPDETL